MSEVKDWPHPPDMSVTWTWVAPRRDVRAEESVDSFIVEASAIFLCVYVRFRRLVSEEGGVGRGRVCAKACPVRCFFLKSCWCLIGLVEQVICSSELRSLSPCRLASLFSKSEIAGVLDVSLRLFGVARVAWPVPRSGVSWAAAACVCADVDKIVSDRASDYLELTYVRGSECDLL